MVRPDLTNLEHVSISEETHVAPPSPAVRQTRRNLGKKGIIESTQLGQSGNIFYLQLDHIRSATQKLEYERRLVASLERKLTLHTSLDGVNVPRIDLSMGAALGTSFHSRPAEDGLLRYYRSYKEHTANKFQPVDTVSNEVEGQNQKRVVVGDGRIHLTDVQSPPKKSAVTTLEDVEKSCEETLHTDPLHVEKTGEDSFVEQITTRSPAKPAPRIEDSVEELDKMAANIEEALDEVILAEQMVTVKNKKAPVSREKVAGTVVPKSAAESIQPVKTARPGFSSMRVKSKDVMKTLSGQEKTVAAVKRMKSSPALPSTKTANTCEVPESKVTTIKVAKRPASLLPPKQPVKVVKPVTVSTFELPGEAVARKIKEQREIRKAQREANLAQAPSTSSGNVAPKIRSAKPTTKSTFELPGEALSRRKREAHEARLKLQEEEDKKRREFKAKPLRKSIVPDVVPRDTATSRARKSQIGLPDEKTSGQSFRSLSLSKRSSVIGAPLPSAWASNLANSSAPRAPGPNGAQSSLTRKPSTISGPSMSGLSKQRTVSVTDAQTQRHRAKEIYSRDMKAIEDVEKEKREREAAAKKSREEAAERGRQASREWAEKQRAKKAAEGDRGMGAGYGPGGQLGLKA
jgi:hypothetical protein